MMKQQFSNITNACFSGLSSSHPSVINKRIKENYYGMKEYKGKNYQYALNPFSGKSVKFHNYERVSEDNLFVTDICTYSTQLGIYIRIDLTQIPTCPIPNTEVGKTQFKNLIKWIEECIQNKKKLSTKFEFEKLISDDDCRDDDCIDDNDDSDDDTSSEMDDFIEKDNYETEDTDYVNESSDDSHDGHDGQAESTRNTKRRKL